MAEHDTESIIFNINIVLLLFRAKNHLTISTIGFATERLYLYDTTVTNISKVTTRLLMTRLCFLDIIMRQQGY